MLGLVVEDLDAEPTADAASDSRHPQQRLLGNPELMFYGPPLVDAVKGEGYEVDQKQIKGYYFEK